MPEQQRTPSATPPHPLAAPREPEIRQVEPMSEEHKQSDQNQRRSDQHFSPFADCLLNGENTRPRTQHSNQHRTQQRIGRDTSERVKQAIEKNAAAVFPNPSRYNPPRRCSSPAGRGLRRSAGRAEKRSVSERSSHPASAANIPYLFAQLFSNFGTEFRFKLLRIQCEHWQRRTASNRLRFLSRPAHLFSNSADHVTSYLSANASFSGLQCQ